MLLEVGIGFQWQFIRFNVLQSQRKAFDSDVEALTKTRLKTREGFEKNRNESDPEKIKALLKEAESVNEFIRKKLMQAELNEKGNYGKKNISLDSFI